MNVMLIVAFCRHKVNYVAILIGVLFLTHQVGAFSSAWLGGVIRESFGSYHILWMMDAALCTFASIMSLRIRS